MRAIMRRLRGASDAADVLEKHVLERRAERRDRDERRAGRGQLGDERLGPLVGRRARSCSGRRRSRVSLRTRAAEPIGHGRRHVRRRRPPSRGPPRGPASARRRCRTRPACPCDRMPTRLHSSSASDRMCELNSIVRPSIAQLQDQIAHLAPADRIEAGHRLVEDHELGIVDERLRDARRAGPCPSSTAAAAGAGRPPRPTRPARGSRGRGAPPARSRTARRSTSSSSSAVRWS